MDRALSLVLRANNYRRRRFISVTTPRKLTDFSNPIESDLDWKFRLRYTFTKDTVLHIILPLVETDLKSARRLQCPPLIQLLTALRFFGKGSFQMEVGDSMKLSQPTVHRIVTKVASLLASKRPQFVKYPDGHEASLMRRQFFELGGIPGIVGAIDCTQICVSNPEGEDSETFRCQKGFFSINTPCVCKPNLEFTNAVARWRGSTHDSRVLENSSLSQNIVTGLLQGNIIGDSGYGLKTWLLTPFDHRTTMDQAQRRFNKGHAKTRNPIERAFGKLKRKFHYLGSTLRTKLTTATAVIVACVVLHNISVLSNELEDGDVAEDDDEVEDIPPNPTAAARAYRQSIVNNYFRL